MVKGPHFCLIYHSPPDKNEGEGMQSYEKNSVKDDTLVLYIDDEEMSRHYFTRLCGKKFNIKCFSSGSPALEFVAENSHRVGVIITDQKMPEMKGTEVIQVVREEYPHVILLLTTAYMDLDETGEAFKEGDVFRFLYKPWDINELTSALSEALDKYYDNLQSLKHKGGTDRGQGDKQWPTYWGDSKQKNNSKIL